MTLTDTPVKLYGIRNCDTVKKARRWLDEHKVDYQFHDFRSDGLDLGTIENWLGTVAVDKLLNRRSTTWKNLDADTRDHLADDEIPDLLLKHSTLIKRPVLETGNHVEIGFSKSTYCTLFDIQE